MGKNKILYAISPWPPLEGASRGGTHAEKLGFIFFGVFITKNKYFYSRR